MSYVKLGMMAVIIPARDGTPMVTPGLVGRFVFVKRAYDPKEVFKDVAGNLVRMNSTETNLSWVVSATTPLPTLLKNVDGTSEDRVWYFFERPIADQCLKAISGPDLGITESDVWALYSPETVHVTWTFDYGLYDQRS